jgi:hypothetical protein
MEQLLYSTDASRRLEPPHLAQLPARCASLQDRASAEGELAHDLAYVTRRQHTDQYPAAASNSSGITYSSVSYASVGY